MSQTLKAVVSHIEKRADDIPFGAFPITVDAKFVPYYKVFLQQGWQPRTLAVDAKGVATVTFTPKQKGKIKALHFSLANQYLAYDTHPGRQDTDLGGGTPISTPQGLSEFLQQVHIGK